MTNDPQQPGRGPAQPENDAQRPEHDAHRPNDDAQRPDNDPTAVIEHSQTHWWDATSTPDPSLEDTAAGTPTRELTHPQGAHEDSPPQDLPRPAPGPVPAAAPAGGAATLTAAPAPALASASAPAPAPAPERVRGPNAAAALLGLACVVVAVLAIARETSGFTVDWGSFGPGAVIAAGALLLLLGLVGLVRRKD